MSETHQLWWCSGTLLPDAKLLACNGSLEDCQRQARLLLAYRYGDETLDLDDGYQFKHPKSPHANCWGRLDMFICTKEVAEIRTGYTMFEI